MIARLSRRLVILTMLWAVLGWGGMARAEPVVTVFAAASLKNALDDIAGQFTQAAEVRVSLSYGGSSALARQIQYGAPAQVFLSANSEWMDLLADQGLVDPATRMDLLTNDLVLIAPQGAEVSLAVLPGMDLAGRLGDGKLAMALVNAVPAGIYGRAALQSLSVWDSVQGQIAQAENVRAALRLVALGEAPLGIVYATDALAEPRVRVLGVFPQDSHPPILYPTALVAGNETAAALAFFGYLTGTQARATFIRHGFQIPGGGP